MAISEFKGKYYYLSNYYTKDFMYNGIVFSCAESAFQLQKLQDPSKIRLLAKSSPDEAKRIGRSVRLPRDWEEKKLGIMLNIIRSKFRDPQLREWLLNTGNEDLIEGNTWHDNYWGDCKCSRCRYTKGQNMLGKILMRVRYDIQKEEERKPMAIERFLRAQAYYRDYLSEFFMKNIDTIDITDYNINFHIEEIKYWFASKESKTAVHMWLDEFGKAGKQKTVNDLADKLILLDGLNILELVITFKDHDIFIRTKTMDEIIAEMHAKRLKEKGIDHGN